MKSLFTISILALICIQSYAQDQIEEFIQEAQTFIAQKEYKQAQLSLQDAINEINTLIAGQIAEALPNEINGLTSSNEQTMVGGGMGIVGGGLQITKSYQHPSKAENNAELVLLANSPLLSSMTMFLANPAMLGEGYKSVRVGTNRAIMKTEMQDYYMDNGSSKQIRSSEIQIPLSQTMITINARGFASEQEELAFATKLDIAKLKVLLGE